MAVRPVVAGTTTPGGARTAPLRAVTDYEVAAVPPDGTDPVPGRPRAHEPCPAFPRKVRRALAGLAQLVRAAAL